MAHDQEPIVVDALLEEDIAEIEETVCSFCSGPPRLCGATRHCNGGPGSALDATWLAAIRSVYGGLVLTRSPAALWGGALLRLSKLLAARALAIAPPSAATIAMAEEHANPDHTSIGHSPVKLALAYLQKGDLEQVSELSRVLRSARAPWLVEVEMRGPRAALSPALDRRRFELIAVLCDACAEPVTAMDQLYQHVDTYDAAIRCPSCGRLPPHPLPGVATGAPHPVSRCLPDVHVAGICVTHDGSALDEQGLCAQGHDLFERTLKEAAAVGRSPRPEDREVVNAVLRAQFRAVDSAMDDATLARRLVTSPAFQPVFAALAKASPEAAETLQEITGAPFDTSAADPGVLAVVTAGSSLKSMITDGMSALQGLHLSLFGKPPPELSYDVSSARPSTSKGK